MTGIGKSATTGNKNKMANMTTMAAKKLESGVWAPAKSLTLLRDNDPEAGNAPVKGERVRTFVETRSKKA